MKWATFFLAFFTLTLSKSLHPILCYADSFEEIEQKASDSYDAKNYSDAIMYYEKCVEMNPNDRNSYYNLALSYEKSALFEKAIENYKKYKELSKDRDALTEVDNVIKDLENKAQQSQKSARKKPRNEPKVELQAQSESKNDITSESTAAENTVSFLINNTECYKSDSMPEINCQYGYMCLDVLFGSVDTKLGKDNDYLMNYVKTSLEIFNAITDKSSCPDVDIQISSLNKALTNVKYLSKYIKEQKKSKWDVCVKKNGKNACAIFERHPDWQINECVLLAGGNVWEGMPLNKFKEVNGIKPEMEYESYSNGHKYQVYNNYYTEMKMYGTWPYIKVYNEKILSSKYTFVDDILASSDYFH